jgi:hypothetical protein
MSSYKLKLIGSSPEAPNRPREPPIHACFSPSTDFLALLWESGYSESWNLHIRLPSTTKAEIMDPKLEYSHAINSGRCFRQISFFQGGQVAILGQTGQNLDVVYVRHDGDRVIPVILPGKNGRLVTADKALIWQATDGQIFESESSQYGIGVLMETLL